MITTFKLFEGKNNQIQSWLRFYKPDSDDEIKDLISRINSIMKTSGEELTVTDFAQITFGSDSNLYYVYDAMFENHVVVMVYVRETDEYIEAYNLKYEDIFDNDIKHLYKFLLERIENHQIYYGLILFADDVYSYTYPEKEYEKIKHLLINCDWYYKDENGEDFLEIINKEYSMQLFFCIDEIIINWEEKIKKDFPEQYKKYIREKQAKKFKI